jgi:hypothetical protein
MVPTVFALDYSWEDWTSFQLNVRSTLLLRRSVIYANKSLLLRPWAALLGSGRAREPDLPSIMILVANSSKEEYLLALIDVVRFVMTL